MRDHNMFNSWTVDDVRQYEGPTSVSTFMYQVRSLGVGCFQPWFSFTMINSFVMKGNDWRITGLCDHFTEVRRLDWLEVVPVSTDLSMLIGPVTADCLDGDTSLETYPDSIFKAALKCFKLIPWQIQKIKALLVDFWNFFTINTNFQNNICLSVIIIEESGVALA